MVLGIWFNTISYLCNCICKCALAKKDSRHFETYPSSLITVLVKHLWSKAKKAANSPCAFPLSWLFKSDFHKWCWYHLEFLYNNQPSCCIPFVLLVHSPLSTPYVYLIIAMFILFETLPVSPQSTVGGRSPSEANHRSTMINPSSFTNLSQTWAWP